jgi:multiple sugar transport system permease protein
MAGDPPGGPVRPPARRPANPRPLTAERGILSGHDLRRRRIRYGLRAVQTVILSGLLIAALGPLVWLAKASVSSTQDLLRDPLGWWPSGIRWGNLAEAWNTIDVGRYLGNTFWIAAGSAIAALVVSLSGAYALAVLRPRYGPLVTGAVLATLFIPGVVSLVPRYLTVLDLPLVHVSLLNSFWAIWLPNAAHAFYVLLAKRFFDRLPRELMEAARVDGASPLRIFVSIVLPMSRPLIGVLGLLALIDGWKEFLWPLLVLPNPEKQPLSVALPRLTENNEQSLVMAGLFITLLIPVLLFFAFQRQFLNAAGQAGALKE